jgi:hypothetical protein
MYCAGHENSADADSNLREYRKNRVQAYFSLLKQQGAPKIYPHSITITVLFM